MSAPTRARSRWLARNRLVAAVALVVLVPIVAGASCEDSASTAPAPSPVDGGLDGSPGGAAGSSVADGGPGGAGGAPMPPSYHPDATDWIAVTWPNPCDVETAVDPQIGAPPLYWVSCGPPATGCEQQFEQPILDTNSQQSKVSVIPRDGGYRIGITEGFKTGGRVAAVYDTDGTALVAWRVADCQMARPIVTADRVWFGVTKTGVGSAYIAPHWDELTTIQTTLQLDFFVQAWWASSEVAVGWSVNGATVFVEDLGTGKAFPFGGGGPGNPDYAWPHAVGTSVVALTAPDGSPDATVWDRSTEWFTTVVSPTPPARVADVNTDGSTLAWIVVPQWGEPGVLWTSPMAVEPGALLPEQRRATPVVGPRSSAAYGGYYAVHSPEVFPGQGPGDNRIHVYRLADARHWAAAVPETEVEAIWITHVDADYVFYSGYGPIVRQRMDVLGPGDSAP